MDVTGNQSGWKAYALAGRPDFLNYLRRGDVGWGDVWRLYREAEVDPEAVVRGMSLFHIFHSQDYDREGCLLQRDQPVYAALREWAEAALDLGERVPEQSLRDSLANLLGQSLVSALYFEAAFNVFVEASADRRVAESHLEAAAPCPEPAGAVDSEGGVRLRTGLPQETVRTFGGGRWHRAYLQVVDQHREAWERAYAGAVGETDPLWVDEGGSG
jgi:hypothetical protein